MTRALHVNRKPVSALFNFVKNHNLSVRIVLHNKVIVFSQSAPLSNLLRNHNLTAAGHRCSHVVRIIYLCHGVNSTPHLAEKWQPFRRETTNAKARSKIILQVGLSRAAEMKYMMILPCIILSFRLRRPVSNLQVALGSNSNLSSFRNLQQKVRHAQKKPGSSTKPGRRKI